MFDTGKHTFEAGARRDQFSVANEAPGLSDVADAIRGKEARVVYP